MKWLRIDAALDGHPDIIAAGFYGARIFEALLRTSKLYDLGGVIPAKYATASYLSRQLGLDADLCHSGLEGAVSATLIERDPEGNITVPGWDEFNGEREVESIRAKARERWHRWNERKQTLANVSKREQTRLTGTRRDETRRDETSSLSDESDPVVATSLQPPAPEPESKKKPRRPYVKKGPGINERVKLVDGLWQGIEPKDRERWMKACPKSIPTETELDATLARAANWCLLNPMDAPRSAFATFLSKWMNKDERKASRQGGIQFPEATRKPTREEQVLADYRRGMQS